MEQIMKLNHKKLIVIAGLVWLAIGIYLLQLGLKFLNGGLNDSDHMPLLHWIAGYVGGKESAILILVLIAAYLGYFKGRFVLGKSAKRGVAHILSLKEPAPIHRIYNLRSYLIIGIMVALGISIKFMGLNHDVRGVVDILIGSALVNGAMVYFRLSKQERVHE